MPSFPLTCKPAKVALVGCLGDAVEFSATPIRTKVRDALFLGYQRALKHLSVSMKNGIWNSSIDGAPSSTIDRRI